MEELECNPMYLALQSKYRKHYEAAQKIVDCCILIPSNESLKHVEVTEDVLNSHIVKPSPYFKGEYTNAFGKDIKTLQIEDYTIKRLSGYPNVISPVRIIGEEVGYNKHGKPFHIYIIDQPLGNLLKVKPNLNLEIIELDFPSSWLEGSSTATQAECRRILQNLHNGEVLKSLDSKIETVVKNYLILPDYLEEASKKLRSIVEKSTREFHAQEKLGNRTSSILQTIVESYLMTGLHNRLFPVICQKFVIEDQALTTKLTELNLMEITAVQLGAMEMFSCPIPASIVELARLDSLMCPREKIQCLKNTIDLVVAEVKQHLLETRGLLTPPGGLPCLTTDDLIPVLLTAIVRARLFHLASDIYYMEHFLWSVSPKDVHSYSFITFKAAVEFLKTANMSRISPAENQLKKELSLEELMEVTEKIGSKKVNSESDDFAQWTPIDRQMERITRMIEASTQDLSSVQHHGVQTTSKWT